MNKLLLILICLFVVNCSHIPTAQEQLADITYQTGLEQINPHDKSPAPTLGKTHRGYKAIVKFQMGDVWTRYASRMAAGEIGRELGGIWAFLTGSHRHYPGTVVGSPFDRLLSEILGQPLAITVVLNHSNAYASRLDILSDFSVLKPSDPVPAIANISYLGAGTLYSNDPNFAKKVLRNSILQSRLECFRSQYIRVDDKAVSFLFAGSENEYSAMIRDCGGYANLINTILDSLADLAELT